MADLKDILASVDWRKMMTGADVRNALIGSALGGLVLGGASYAADRDPEESHTAPVGDALTGALLGAVAGYGVPKGLALFRDSGSLAPDGDRLSSFRLGPLLGAGLLGGGIGSAVVGGSLLKTLYDEDHLLSGAKDDTVKEHLRSRRETARNSIRRQRLAEQQSGASADRLAALDRQAAMYSENPAEARRVMDSVRRRRWANILSRSPADVAARSAAATELTDLEGRFTKAWRGYRNLGDLVRRVGARGGQSGAGTWLEPLMHPLDALRNFAKPEHYRRGRVLFGLTRRLSPGLKMLYRTGKYGAIGAGAAMLIRALMGAGSRDNYSN